MTRKALVLFSGGQDSTTCLAWALERFSHVETVAFDYGQRHSVELHARLSVLARLREMSTQWHDRLGRDHVLDLKVLGEITDSALTRESAISMEDGLPNTFVPGRNLIFLAIAAALAFQRDAADIVIGVCEADYSGYPDCRDETIKAMQAALNRGMGRHFSLHTPLMWIDKAATWRLAKSLGGEPFVELVRQETHSCYQGDHSQLNEWGFGCGNCPACLLRAAGYETFTSEAA